MQVSKPPIDPRHRQNPYKIQCVRYATLHSVLWWSICPLLLQNQKRKKKPRQRREAACIAACLLQEREPGTGTLGQCSGWSGTGTASAGQTRTCGWLGEASALSLRRSHTHTHPRCPGLESCVPRGLGSDRAGVAMPLPLPLLLLPRVARSPGLDRANVQDALGSLLAQWQTPLLGWGRPFVLLLPPSRHRQLAGFPPMRFESSSGRSSKNDCGKVRAVESGKKRGWSGLVD